MLDLSRLQKQQLVYYSLVLIVAVLWKVLRPIRRHIWTSYDNLPLAPGLTFKEDHDSLASKHPVSSLYREWFASLGGTIRIRVRPYYRPIILTADPNFLAYVQRKSEDFEESARMGPTLRAMGLDHCIPCVSGDHHRRVKAALGTMISPSACRHYFPRMLAAAWQVTGAISEIEDNSGAQKFMARATATRYMINVLSSVVLGPGLEHTDGQSLDVLQRLIGNFHRIRSKFSWIDNRSLYKTDNVRAAEKALRDLTRYGEAIAEEKKRYLRESTDMQGLDPTEPYDMLTSLCRNNMDANVKASQKLSDLDIAHNAPFLILGSMDIQTVAIVHILHSVAANPDVQTKLRDNLSSLGDNPTLDELNGITYLDHVIEEVMRMRQPYQALERKCTRSCVVPLRYPVVGRDGHLIECVKVTKGDEVWIPLLAFNHDKRLFGDDAEVFRPERFADGTVSADLDDMSFAWGRSTTFSGGSRGCPMFNYALASSKALIFTIMRSYHLSLPSSQTVSTRHGSKAFFVNGKAESDIPIIFTPL